MIDRTTKLLLAAIAVGLFLNAAVPLIQPTEVMAEEAQRGPRGGGGPAQPQVQGNVQSEGALRNQQAREERDRVLNNPEANTDTDRWLRLIRMDIAEMESSLGPGSVNGNETRTARSDLKLIVDRLLESQNTLSDIQRVVSDIDNGLCGSGQTYNRFDC